YISNALQKPRDYDQQLTYIAATATGGQGMTPEARLAARGQLNEYIKAAVRGGGGTREDAAEAANALIASGKYELNNVAPALNMAVKTAFATNAAATDAAALTVRMQDFGVNDLQRGHDIAMRGGQLGSFEYKDMSKWLAQQMAAARVVGYSGEKGLVELVAMNQVAMKTAGTADEAGNNVVNLLAKLSSREFSKSISDAVVAQAGDPTKSDGKKKPKQVFDWGTYSVQQREQGVYGVEAFGKLLERQLAGNAQY
ncbi:phage tail tape measure protein, partial [Acinetobacter baumannii]|uniref:phage tail tape measure protein n=1 Tax=Acinetobacter baumannii TaxID=470 RepID=UPI001C43A487